MNCPHLKTCPKRTAKTECLHWISFPMGPRDSKIAKDEFNCAYNWQAIMAYHLIRYSEGIQQATESFRNETVVRQDAALRLAIANNGQRKKLLIDDEL